MKSDDITTTSDCCTDSWRDSQYLKKYIDENLTMDPIKKTLKSGDDEPIFDYMKKNNIESFSYGGLNFLCTVSLKSYSFEVEVGEYSSHTAIIYQP